MAYQKSAESFSIENGSKAFFIVGREKRLFVAMNVERRRKKISMRKKAKIFGSVIKKRFSFGSLEMLLKLVDSNCLTFLQQRSNQ
jgi:hypothetical protein